MKNIDYSRFKASDHQIMDNEGARDSFTVYSRTFHLGNVSISSAANSTDGVFF